MTPSFLDIHNAILDEAKLGIPFPYISKKKPDPEPEIKIESEIKSIQSTAEVKKRIKQDISCKQAKDLILSKKKDGCSICGYNRCNMALDFHHVKPDEKLFSLSKAGGKSLSEILEEISKCILVCSNCHKEIHAGIIKV